MTQFFESFGFFWQTYLASLVMSMVLGFLGVFVVTRGQVFIAAAVSQASLLGVAVGLLFGMDNTVLLAVAFSVAGAVFIGQGIQVRRSAFEERTALVFIFAASLAVLLLSSYPNGLRQLQAAASSSILGAGMVELVFFALLAAGLAGFFLTRRNRIILYVLDPVMAAAVGMNIGLWSLGISAVVGLSVGLSIHISGLLFAFGALVLPAMTARNIASETGLMFLLSPVIAFIGTLAGLFFSVTMDLPPGQTSVFASSVLLMLSWAFRLFRF